MLVVKMLPFEPIDRAKKLWMFGLVMLMLYLDDIMFKK
jgi:hypothetical protein